MKLDGRLALIIGFATALAVPAIAGPEFAFRAGTSHTEFGLRDVLLENALAQQTTPPPIVANPQQPEPLPTGPLKPGEKSESPLIPFIPSMPVLPILPVLPEELPLLPGELPLRRAPEAKPRELPRYKLQLAIDAMHPVLPPLDHRLAGASLATSARVTVKKYVFEGNHVFSARQLAKVVAPFAGREISSEELEEARVAVTKHYVDAGYITSGALLPDQDVASGVIKFQIVEGRLTEIKLNGNFWFRDWWLRNQLRRAAGQPVNFNHLKIGLQLLRQNPLISSINAELEPGVNPGESILDVVKMKDEQPFRAGFLIANNRPPSVSEGIGELYLGDLNVTGHNDPLDLRWGLARWTDSGDINYAGFDNASANYEFPVTPWDTTLSVHASKNDSSIIDETFAALGISSKTTQYGAALHQPLYKTLTNTVTASGGADWERSETFLLGEPFTLALGENNGKATVFVSRLNLEWVNRSEVHVLAFRSGFNIGMYGLHSTHAGADSIGSPTSGAGGGADAAIPDSKFFSWLAQAQYVRRIFDGPLHDKPDTLLWNALRESLLVLRVNSQLSDSPLLALEQFSLGGMQSVRGYRENQLLRDNGVFASAELQVPVWLAKDKSPIVSLASFFDYGAGWNESKLDDNYQAIYSVGAGVLVNATKHAQVKVYWGHPFVNFHEQNVSLQDYGVHLAVTINAF